MLGKPPRPLIHEMNGITIVVELRTLNTPRPGGNEDDPLLFRHLAHDPPVLRVALEDNVGWHTRKGILPRESLDGITGSLEHPRDLHRLDEYHACPALLRDEHVRWSGRDGIDRLPR